jgi:SnoaL-like polyketide cyclase
MTLDEPKTMARRVAEDIGNQRDLAVVNALISPDYVHHGPGSQPVPGLAALQDWLTLTLSIFPDFQAIVEDEIAEDGRLVQRITCSGTLVASARWES